jgi:prophage regulatory protein
MPDNTRDDLPDTLLTRAQVLEIVPLSYPTLWVMMRRGEFPKPIRISKQRVAWKISEVHAWQQGCPRQELKANKEEDQ